MSVEPVAEQIAALVAYRLSFISQLGNYQVTVPDVQRPTRFDTPSPIPFRTYVNIDSLTPNELLGHSGNPPVQGWDMVVRCSMMVTPLENDTTKADTWRLRAYASMSRAITTGVDWYNWNGLAVNSQILEPEMRSTPEEGQVGAHLLVNIQFRTDESNPYQVRF